MKYDALIHSWNLGTLRYKTAGNDKILRRWGNKQKTTPIITTIKKRCESTEKDKLPLCFHSHGAFLSTNWKKHLVSVKVRHRWQERLTGNVLSSVSGILKEAVHKHLNYRRPKHHTKLFSPKHRFIWSTINNCGCSQVVTPCEPFNSLNTCACACTHNTCFIRAKAN